MGNRAVLQFGQLRNSLGIYLHWNGGRASVQGFLNAVNQIPEYRGQSKDYKTARLIQLIGLFFPGGYSVGVDIASNLDRDNGDNGTYIIDEDQNNRLESGSLNKDLTIIDRLFINKTEKSFCFIEEINQEKTDEICKSLKDKIIKLKEIEKQQEEEEEEEQKKRKKQNQ